MIRRVYSFSIFAMLCCLLMSGNASGDINFFTDFEYINTENTSEDKTTGNETETSYHRFTQLYNLQLERQIYPNLRFRGGGLYELEQDETSTEDFDTDGERQTIRPFLELRFSTPLYSAGAGYSKTEVKRSGTSISTERQFAETYDANFLWRPLNLPGINANYTHTTLYDEPKTYEIVNKYLSVDTSYALQNLSLYYGYSRDESERKETDFSTLNQGHNGRISYFHTFFDKKVRLNTSYQVRYRTTDFSGAGGGLSPVPRIEGLFFPNEDIEDPPNINDGLTDGPDNPTDINIGSTGVTNRIGMGIDFGLPNSVDTLFLWVDRDISEVSDSFQWEIFVALEDNECRDITTTWVPHATVFPGTFSAVRNRFEISFPEVETRCIKVVTTPLDGATPAAVRYPEIFVTEMEVFTAISAFGRPRTTSTAQSFRIGSRWTISPDTSAGYDLSYQTNETEPEGRRSSTLTNTVDIRHVFNRTFTGSARVMRADGRQEDEHETRESTDHSYGATISAAWLPTFGQSLTYNGHYSEEEGETRQSDSIVLRNHALLYKGWSVFLDAGYIIVTQSEGDDVENSYVRTGTHISPHRRASLNVNYTMSWSETGGEERRKKTANGQLFLLPFDTLSLTSTASYFEDEDETRWIQTYSANWAPFPDGTIRLSMYYSASQSDGSETEKRETQTYGPRFEWRIAHWSTLKMQYAISETETDIRRSESQNFLANLRISL